MVDKYVHVVQSCLKKTTQYLLGNKPLTNRCSIFPYFSCLLPCPSLVTGSPNSIHLWSSALPWKTIPVSFVLAQLVKNPPAMQETPVRFLGKGRERLPTPVYWPGEFHGLYRRSAGEDCPLQYSWASLVAQLVKNPPAMRETWVWSLGREDPLEMGKATHSSVPAWRIPWTV